MNSCLTYTCHCVGTVQCISSEVFVPCLVDLCKALWELMKSYYRTLEWHRRHDAAMATQAPAVAAADDSHGLFTVDSVIHNSII